MGEDMRIVRYKGGLGNQMFQYAFMRSLDSGSHKAGASLGFYKDFPMSRHFELDKVFYNVQLKEESRYDEIFNTRYAIWKNKSEADRDQLNVGIWFEEREEEGKYQQDVYEQEDCVFVGYWQSYRYFETIKEKIRYEFSFPEEAISAINSALCLDANSVVVHIRRGDYLQAEDMYGNICTNAYYLRAIAYMREKIENPTFFFVSDDIEWVAKQNLVKDGIYIKSDSFKKYEDWYDMAIMSLAGHNIIANSSFSWWGAWLNQNQQKIVIAPKKWNNLGNYTDICPPDWIRI